MSHDIGKYLLLLEKSIGLSTIIHFLSENALIHIALVDFFSSLVGVCFNLPLPPERAPVLGCFKPGGVRRRSGAPRPAAAAAGCQLC